MTGEGAREGVEHTAPSLLTSPGPKGEGGDVLGQGGAEAKVDGDCERHGIQGWL